MITRLSKLSLKRCQQRRLLEGHLFGSCLANRDFLPKHRILCRDLLESHGWQRRFLSTGNRNAGQSNQPPRVDSTTFFRFANPELFLDPKSPRTWGLVAFVWVSFGTAYFYLRWQEANEEELLKGPQVFTPDSQPEGQIFGPAPRPSEKKTS